MTSMQVSVYGVADSRKKCFMNEAVNSKTISTSDVITASSCWT